MLNLETGKQEERYLRFTVNGGKEIYEVPYLKSLPSDPYLDRIVAIGNGDEESRGTATLALFCDVLDEHAPELRKTLPIDLLNKLMEEWAKGADVGESSASPE